MGEYDRTKRTTAVVLKTFADPDGTIHKAGEVLRLGAKGIPRIKRLEKLGYVKSIKRGLGRPTEAKEKEAIDRCMRQSTT